MSHLTTDALHAGLDEIRGAPAEDGRVELNLRGVNAKVLVAGRVNVGDTVRKVNKSAATARPV